VEKVIMTVDDSTTVRQMVSFTLGDAGYQVVEANDGKDALSKLGDSTTIDMLITDLNMPNLDGIELIKNVRTQARHKFVPILMLTTESQDAKKQQGKAAGASGWIVKPFSATQLVDVVRKLLK
jgi:two-component system, chemotaxis family, chemotaxis protein CheY